MITYDVNQTVTDDNKWLYEINFKGLSTDQKPVRTYKNMPIGNGSTFLELDTMNISMYDGRNNRWV